MYAFAIPLTERPRLILVLDEAEHVLERDGELLGTILAEGRSLGIHLVLIFHTFSQITKDNPELLASVLTHCKTKFLGGRLYQDDLDVLSKDLFTEEWHPHIVRDELYSLETEPIETTRETVTESYSHQEGTSIQYPRSTTRSQSTGVSDGTQDSFGVTEGETISEARSHTDSHGVSFNHAESEQEAIGEQHSRSRAIGESQAESRMRSETDMASENWMDGSSAMQGMAESLGAGTTLSYGMDENMFGIPMALGPVGMSEISNTGSSSNTGSASSSARGGGRGSAASSGEAESNARSVVEAEGIGASHVRSRGRMSGAALMQGSADATMQGRSSSRATTANHGTSHQVSESTSVGETQGETPGENETRGRTYSRSIVPFHELKKRWVVSSREFLSLQDFLTTKLNRISGARKAHWVVQPPEGAPVFFTARFVKPLPGGKERLPALYEKVFSRPAWRAMRESLARMIEPTGDAFKVTAYRIEEERIDENEAMQAFDEHLIEDTEPASQSPVLEALRRKK